MKAEEKVANVTIKNINKEIKKVPKKKISKPKKNSVMYDVEKNDYLKICKQKRGRNKQVLSQIVEDLKKRRRNSPKRTPKQNLRKKISSPKTTLNPRKILSTSKKATSPKRTPKQKKDLAKAKPKIKCSHQNSISYEPESDRRYCKEGMDLEGVSCSKCSLKFGEPRQPPSITQPIWVCCNRRNSDCTHSLCGTCYHDKTNDAQLETRYSKRRTRR